MCHQDLDNKLDFKSFYFLGCPVLRLSLLRMFEFHVTSKLASHHGMARLLVAGGGVGLQVWRVAANVLDKQSRTPEKWSCIGGGGLGRGCSARG